MSSGIDERALQPDYSAVPPAVRAKAAEAERIFQVIREGKNPMDPASYAQPDTQQPPAPERQEPRQEPKQPPAPTQEPPRQEARQEPPKDAAKGNAELEKSEQRYRTLQGMFDTMQKQVTSLERENDSLRQTIEELEARVTTDGNAQPAQLPAGKVFNINEVMSEDERSEWGPELTDILARVTTAATAPLQAEIARLQGSTTRITKERVENARDAMHRTLDTDVPDWRDINTSEDFLEWVNKTDQASGQRRLKLLNEAYKANETERVSYLFSSFLREVRGASPEVQRQQVGQGRASAPKSKDLTDYAAPGKGKAAGADDTRKSGQDAAPEKPITRADVTSFYTNKALKRLKMSPEEIDAYEARINQAYAENRL